MENAQLIAALTDFFELQQQADGDFVGEQRDWHLIALPMAFDCIVGSTRWLLLFPSVMFSLN